MVTAAAQDQWRLLDVQAHDTRLSQIAHRQRTLPEHAQVEQLQAQLADINSRLVVARTAASDAGREFAKAETDVEQVRQRIVRNQARLDSGQGNAKDLTGLQHELESLAGRQSTLEDVQLEIMERQEAAESAAASTTLELEQIQQQLAQAQQDRDKQLTALDAEAENERRERENAAAGVPVELIALYEKIREQSGGVGAARLYQRRCEGCRLGIPPNDISRFRTAPENEILRCEECRRILIRTADSGL